MAVFATARKLPTLIYRMLRWCQDYVDEGAEAYEKRYRKARLRRRAPCENSPHDNPAGAE